MDWDVGRSWPQSRIGTAVIGQFLSVCIATTSVFSALLAQKGVSLPATQSSANYFLLALVYGSVLLVRRRRLRGACWAYAALALVDVQANMLIVAAFRYTSITSVTLLDCATIPAVMVLSYFVFRARYRFAHLGGAALCVLGLATLLGTDRATSGSGKNPPLGNLLVLLAAMLYAVGNVAQESLLGDADAPEVLAMMGGFGTLWSGIAVAALERRQLAVLDWTWTTFAFAAGFNGAMFAYYSCVPLVLKWHSAAFMNVSLLTSDLWAAAARIVLFGGFTNDSALYFSLAFTLVATGLSIYAFAPHIYDSRSLKPGGPAYSLAQTAAYSFAPPTTPTIIVTPRNDEAFESAPTGDAPPPLPALATNGSRPLAASGASPHAPQGGAWVRPASPGNPGGGGAPPGARGATPGGGRSVLSAFPEIEALPPLPPPPAKPPRRVRSMGAIARVASRDSLAGIAAGPSPRGVSGRGSAGLTSEVGAVGRWAEMTGAGVGRVASAGPAQTSLRQGNVGAVAAA